jgi:hypothetical protein
MKPMNDNAIPAPNDLITDIMSFERQLIRKAKEAGLRNQILDDRLKIQPSKGAPSEGAAISFEFKAGSGVDLLLTSIVSSVDVDTQERRDELAENFLLHMQRAVVRAPEAAASRRAITAAAVTVIAEAAAEGIELELLRLEPAPVPVFGRPRIEDENAQVFYVHIVMPHLHNGALTRDSYTVDADDAEEFADYLRHRTIPELRDLLRAHGELEPAA